MMMLLRQRRLLPRGLWWWRQEMCRWVLGARCAGIGCVGQDPVHGDATASEALRQLRGCMLAATYSAALPTLAAWPDAACRRCLPGVPPVLLLLLLLLLCGRCSCAVHALRCAVLCAGGVPAEPACHDAPGGAPGQGGWCGGV